MEEKNIYSVHYFMFPFRWDMLRSGFSINHTKEDIPFDQRTAIDEIQNEFGEWKRKRYSLSSITQKTDAIRYSEFQYFHEFVSKAIFDFDYSWKINQNIVKYFEYNIDKNIDNKYIIEYLEDSKKYTIELEVTGITMHLFNTGVGVLTFDLINTIDAQSDEGTILKINEFGRRMYPQFLSEDGIDVTKNTFLANKIELIINNKSIATEDFNLYNLEDNKSTVQEPYSLPNYIKNLFPDCFIFNVDGKLSSNKILITKVTDDRMFFHSWYGNETTCNRIIETFKEYTKVTDDWWFAYIFGDKKIKTSIANSVLQEKITNEHSYLRWVELGTLFGISRDSFVCLAQPAYVRTHMRSMYYTISVLCLAQRASILKFTSEIAHISDLAKIKNNEKKVIKNIKEIYKNYIEFINKLYFREVTPQIQGIELYNQFQKILNIETEIKDLDNEISELHEYVSLLQDNERNDEAAKLNRLATIFLPATLMFGILGANFLTDKNFTFSNGIDWHAIKWITVGLSISIVVCFYF